LEKSLLDRNESLTNDDRELIVRDEEGTSQVRERLLCRSAPFPVLSVTKRLVSVAALLDTNWEHVILYIRIVNVYTRTYSWSVLVVYEHIFPLSCY